MEQTDYGKYFITDTPRHPDHPQSRDRDSDIPWCDTLYVSGELGGQVPGASVPGDLHDAPDRFHAGPPGAAQPRLRRVPALLGHRSGRPLRPGRRGGDLGGRREAHADPVVRRVRARGRGTLPAGGPPGRPAVHVHHHRERRHVHPGEKTGSGDSHRQGRAPHCARPAGTPFSAACSAASAAAASAAADPAQSACSTRKRWSTCALQDGESPPASCA